MKKVKKYKISRRLQMPLFEKCQTQKFALREQRKKGKTQKRMKKVSDYNRQLLEKQKLRFLYSISEQNLKNYVKKTEKAKSTDSIKYIGELVERRLDNIVYRLGVVPTRRMGRQAVSHGHFTINGVKMTIPSYSVKDSDVIGIRDGSKNTKMFKEIMTKKINPKVGWVKWDQDKKEGSVTGTPIVDEGIFDISAILGYYSR